MTKTLSPLALVAFFITLIAPVIASPFVHNVNAGNTFSVPLVHDADKPRHGPSEILRTLKKFNLEIPNGLQEVVDKHHAKMAVLATHKDGNSAFFLIIFIYFPGSD